MTPSGPHPSSYPQQAGGAAAPEGPHGPGHDGHGPLRPEDVLREVRTGAVVAVAVGVFGVLFGLLWLWLSPRVPIVSDGQAIYLKDGEGEQAIGIDGWFTLLGAAFGLVSGVVVFCFRRRGGIAVVIGLAVGGLLASLLAWRVGVWLGPSGDLRARAEEAGVGKAFDKPLELQAKAALLIWPMLAMLAHLVVTAAFGPRDPEPPADRHAARWAPPPPPSKP